jgi:rubrerythrin
MRSPVYGYSNTIERHQSPKSEHGLRGKAHAETKTLTDTTGSRYVWNGSLRTSASMAGSGLIDQRSAWRCADCGLESSDVTADCCPRCGSCEPLVYR